MVHGESPQPRPAPRSGGTNLAARAAKLLALLPALVLALALPLAVGCSRAEPTAGPATGSDTAPGAESGAGPVEATPAGRWRPARATPTEAELKERSAELEAIGYMAGTRAAGAAGGAQVIDAERLEPGLNLVVSGHAPEALLMTSDGEVLHRWAIACRSAFPAVPPGDQPRFQYFRRAHLLPDGELLAIFEGTGLVKLRPDSSLAWAWPGRAHHDLDVRPDGRIVTLAREVHVVPRIDPVEPIVEDSVVELSADGIELRRVSLLEALEAAEGLDAADARVRAVFEATRGDVFHANTARLVDRECGDPTPARPGDVLVSIRSLGLVGVLDFDAGRLRWVRSGSWRGQHQPELLAGCRLLLFDNLGLKGRSRALELDLATGAETWSYSGTDDDPLWSETCGSVQRLPNGNTLVVESDGGRALSVAPDGRVVWRFDSPWRAGERGELVATLFDLQRLPADLPLDWLH